MSSAADPVERGHPDRDGEPGRARPPGRPRRPGRTARRWRCGAARRCPAPGPPASAAAGSRTPRRRTGPPGRSCAVCSRRTPLTARSALSPDQVAVGVVDHLEVVDVQQGDAQRAARPDRPGDLPFGLALPGGHVEQAGLGVDAGLGQQLRVHHEPPGQQDGGHGEDGQHRLDGHHHGDEDAQVHLGEVAEQRLAVQREVGDPGGGVGELHRGDDQEVVQQPAGDLGRGDGHGPGQGVRPGTGRRSRRRTRGWRGTPATPRRRPGRSRRR